MDKSRQQTWTQMYHLWRTAVGLFVPLAVAGAFLLGSFGSVALIFYCAAILAPIYCGAILVGMFCFRPQMKTEMPASTNFNTGYWISIVVLTLLLALSLWWSYDVLFVSTNWQGR